MFYAIMDRFFFRIDALIHKNFIGWLSPSCLAFLKSKMSSSVAAIANLIKNSQAVKKVRPPKKAMVKKDVKSKVAAKKWL